jgi:hypothetical protein
MRALTWSFIALSVCLPACGDGLSVLPFGELVTEEGATLTASNGATLEFPQGAVDGVQVAFELVWEAGSTEPAPVPASSTSEVEAVYRITINDPGGGDSSLEKPAVFTGVATVVDGGGGGGSAAEKHRVAMPELSVGKNPASSVLAWTYEDPSTVLVQAEIDDLGDGGSVLVAHGRRQQSIRPAWKWDTGGDLLAYFEVHGSGNIDQTPGGPSIDSNEFEADPDAKFTPAANPGSITADEWDPENVKDFHLDVGRFECDGDTVRIAGGQPIHFGGDVTVNVVLNIELACQPSGGGGPIEPQFFSFDLSAPCNDPFLYRQDGGIYLAAPTDGEVASFDIATGTVVYTYNAAGGKRCGVAPGPNCQGLLVGGPANQLQVVFDGGFGLTQVINVGTVGIDRGDEGSLFVSDRNFLSKRWVDQGTCLWVRENFVFMGGLQNYSGYLPLAFHNLGGNEIVVVVSHPTTGASAALHIDATNAFAPIVLNVRALQDNVVTATIVELEPGRCVVAAKSALGREMRVARVDGSGFGPNTTVRTPEGSSDVEGARWDPDEVVFGYCAENGPWGCRYSTATDGVVDSGYFRGDEWRAGTDCDITECSGEDCALVLATNVSGEDRVLVGVYGGDADSLFESLQDAGQDAGDG